MDRDTILTPADCELTRLPLDAIEAFVLSQIDGQLTLEEVGEITGLDFAKTARLAERLVELGAVSAVYGDRSPRSKRTSRAPGRPAMRPDPRAETASIRPAPRAEKISTRIDPRAETQSLRPAARAEKQSLRPAARAEKVSTRIDPRAEGQSLRPAARVEKASVRPDKRSLRPKAPEPRPQPRPEPRKEPRRSTKAMRAVKADDDTCELDAETLTLIVSLDAKLGSLDHYAVLEVDRGAEKRDIKRAYFALAAKFHPDRFFRKKLGKARAPLDRIFIRLTEAHDTLSTRARRSEYDATLPGPPPEVRRPSRRLSKSLAKSSKTAMKAAQTRTSTPPKAKTKTIAPTATGGSDTAGGSTERLWPPPLVRGADAGSPSAASDPEPTSVAPASADKFRRAYAAATQIKAQNSVDLFMQAAEEALRNEDVIGAANNYRLALQNSDDPIIRERLEMVDQLAKTARSDKSLARARAAERDKRWADAAHHFAKANEARPDASIADRAAYALRMSNGDLHRAVALAEQAIAAEPKNVGYRVTLGEIYLAAKLYTRAQAESARALELSPRDARALELAAAIPKK
jgi:hypothetical protein